MAIDSHSRNSHNRGVYRVVRLRVLFSLTHHYFNSTKSLSSIEILYCTLLYIQRSIEVKSTDHQPLNGIHKQEFLPDSANGPDHDGVNSYKDPDYDGFSAIAVHIVLIAQLAHQDDTTLQNATYYVVEDTGPKSDRKGPLEVKLIAKTGNQGYILAKGVSRKSQMDAAGRLRRMVTVLAMKNSVGFTDRTT
ncbi:hypothetical protein BDV95DRAFT_613120 [Massariosphaeria phaeospora]|uniref:Uncharacterized protein n=1 Tax=Massariosphaeria phaeospora TaxID=100035 RepID=A0A7C8HYE0_9PLEO|nr:hypothetical protein BDV95DRAFT_613120 [Massariosphaeria phaeospora]